MKSKFFTKKQFFALALTAMFLFMSILPVSAVNTQTDIPSGGESLNTEAVDNNTSEKSNTEESEKQIEEENKNTTNSTKTTSTDESDKEKADNSTTNTNTDELTKFNGAPCAAGNVIVVFSEDISTSTAKKEIENWDTTAETPVKTNGDLTEVNVPQDSNVNDFIEKLEKEDNVEHVQPNFLYKTSSASSMTNDPKVADPYNQKPEASQGQWHLAATNVANDDDTISAWDFAQGEGVKIAILDTGANPTIPEFADNIKNKDVDAYDAVKRTKLEKGHDDHGTHVAGIAAAVGNNGELGAGVSYKSSLMLINVFINAEGAYTSDIIHGYEYAVANGARVVNMSFGSYGKTAEDKIMEEVLNKGYAKGVINVASAGNGNTSTYSSPADFSKCISVTALQYTTKDGQVTGKTRANYSDYNTYKDIAAPGSNVYSNDAYSPLSPLTRLKPMSGTSMASPYIAGVMGLILSANPDLTPAQATNILYSTANDLGAKGKDNYYGYGEANPLRAVKKALLMKASLTTDKTTAFFPDNPADLKVTLKLPVDTKASINVVDSNGKTIKVLADNVSFTANTEQDFYWNYTDNDGVAAQSDDYTIQAVLPYNNSSDKEYIAKPFTLRDIAEIKTAAKKYSATPNNLLDINMTAYADINASAKIVDSGDNVVKTIFENKAFSTGDSTSLKWNYKDDSGKLLTQTGDYKIILDATSSTYGAKTKEKVVNITIPPAPKATLTATKSITINSWNKATVKYNLNTPSYTTVKIYTSNNKLVRTLVNKKLQSGTNTVTWNFKNANGKYVPGGTYKVQISGYNLYKSFNTVTVKTALKKPAKPKITKVKISKAKIARANSVSTKLTLRTNVKSQVKVVVKNKKGKVIRTIYNKVTNAGNKSFKWNLKTDSKKLVAAGTYRIVAYSKNSSGIKAVSKKVKVVKIKPKMTKVKTKKSYAAYYSAKSKPNVTFNLSGGSAAVTANVYTKTGKFVRTIFDKKTLLQGKRRITWNCKNYNGNYVSPGTYYIKVVAKNPSGSKTIRTQKFKMGYKLYLDYYEYDVYRYGNKVYVDALCDGLPKNATAVIKFYNPSGKLVKTLKKLPTTNKNSDDYNYGNYASYISTSIDKSTLKTKGIFTVKTYFTYKGNKSNTRTAYVNVV